MRIALIKSQGLFALLSIALFLYTIVVNSQAIDIQIKDTYYVVSDSIITIALGILSGIIALLYYIFEKLNRSINLHIGFWHFMLFSVFTVVFIYAINFSQAVYFVAYNVSKVKIIMLFLLFLIAANTIVFIYGFVKAMLKKSKE